MELLPQKHTAPPDFTVKDLVGYGRVPHKKWYARSSPEDEEIVRWAMEVTGTSHLAEKSIRACSGGEAQKGVDCHGIGAKTGNFVFG